MFSEYASRFLAQSQSRISSFRQPTSDSTNEPSRNPTERQRRLDGGARFAPSRRYLQRPALGNPYQAAASHFAQFPFASRASAAPAPLFFSATDEFREEDDEAEREREVADFYALQRSRRHFGASQLQESSEVDDDGSRASGLGDSDSRGADERGFARGGGIKSSWRGERADRVKGDLGLQHELNSQDENGNVRRSADAERGRMVDIGLESALGPSVEHVGDPPHPSEDVSIEVAEDDPPAFQQFRRPPSKPSPQFAHATFLPYAHNSEHIPARPRPPSSDASSIPPSIAFPTTEPPRHDSFWSSLYFISLASLFATFFLIYLHTSPPSKKHPLGDTIYTTLQSSFHLLAVDTLVAVVVSLLWLSLLRSFVRPLVYGMLIAVPVILTSFSIYPFAASFRGASHGTGLQDRAMRWLSVFPAISALLWVYTVARGRHSLRKATDILEFTCRILAANPALLVLGLATLVGVVLWTWIWMAMFTRVFLGGHLANSKGIFVIDGSTWWLGAYFVLVYIWTLGVGSGIQRATTAAVVSQWYFHRLSIAAPTSQQVVLAALNHALTTGIGTICLSSLLALLVRLPFILLPRRITGALNYLCYSFLPSSIAALTNPLTLTHAAIHSQPLTSSAKSLGQMIFLAPASTRTTTLHPGDFSSVSPLLPYRLAKLLLHATRFMMSLALGFGGWVSTARMLVIDGAGPGIRGSLYAYVVGLIAAAIGWGVLGAMEGVLGGVLDAAIVCWGSESRFGGGGRYCLEANYLFGEEGGRAVE